jgi:hypothetical protein
MGSQCIPQPYVHPLFCSLYAIVVGCCGRSGLIFASRVGIISNQLQSSEWATMEESTQPVTNFHFLVPDMAFKYPFELDTFQKKVSRISLCV